MIDRVEDNKDFRLDAFRTGKAYTVAQAARLAGTTPTTVRRWLVGYEAPGHRMEPVFGGRGDGEESPIAVSFLQLVEIAVAAKFRSLRPVSRCVSLDRLRAAHRFARDQLHLKYPFATLPLFEFGGHLLHDFEMREPGPGILALDVGGQWALPEIVQQEGHQLDFGEEDPFAIRWFPLGRQAPVVVDPRIAAGRPTIYRRGITLDTVTRRWRAGDTIEQLAWDYELESGDVEQVLRYAA